MKRTAENIPIKISGIYAGLSISYILVSDWVVEAGMAAGWRPEIQTYKGIGFVLVSAVIIALLIHRELAKRKELERAFVRTQRMEAVGQMTNGVAHDFNNMLSVILGNLEMIEEDTRADPKTVRRARNAITATEKGADLTRRLLAFSRQHFMEPRLIDANDSIRQMQYLFETALGETVSFRMQLSDELPRIHVDPSRFENALLNLVINARDAMPDGGAISITTTSVSLESDYADGKWKVPKGDYVMIAVNDDGTGMSRAVMDRLFEPFFTTKSKDKGTGLGLSMVHGFLKQSGGSILVYSAPGRGTTVKLYFPLTFVGDAPPEKTRSEPAVPQGTESILLVENDPAVAEVIEENLVRLGYRVKMTRRAAEALEVLQSEEKFDLMMTDIILGDKRTGVELAKDAREIDPSLSILLISGFADPVLTGQLADFARIGWLAKPFGQAAMAQKVRDLLDQ